MIVGDPIGDTLGSEQQDPAVVAQTQCGAQPDGPLPDAAPPGRRHLIRRWRLRQPVEPSRLGFQISD
jgi:hypothetical protein